MASTALAAATAPTSPPAPNDPQPTTTNASSAPPSTTTATVSPSMRSLKDGTQMFDIRMNPYHLKYPALPPETNPQIIPAQLPMPTLTPNAGLSPYHDGRIRNPVPSKLKGKTDGRQGNFSVMQIDVPRPEMTERDLAAKRTSEGTAAAARLANSQGYRHPKRPRPSATPPAPPVRFRPYPAPVLPAPPRPIPQPPPLAPAVSVEKAPMEKAPAEKAPASDPPTQATSPSIQEISPPPQAQEIGAPSTGPSGLSPHDTKTEQARLLTLLRSLHPILVVDQLCKALAYFGGIPGAPPPADGVFPQSAGTNGPGSLFVAWISEIFPHLDNVDKATVTQTPPAIPPVGAPGTASITNSSTTNAAPATVKRSRGRPKGSKSSKVRKDKGIKKKVVTGSESTHANDATATQFTPAEQAPEALQPPTTGDQEQATAAVTQANSNSTVQPTTPHVGKKRGRPKGSKNKPKPHPGTQDGGADPSNTTAANPVVDSPLAHKTASNQQDVNVSTNLGNTGTGLNGMTANSVQPEPNGSVLVQESAVASDADNSVDQPPLPTPLSTQSTPIAVPRKRKPSQQTPQTNIQAMATPSSNGLQVPDTVSRSGNSPRTQNTKRRRVSEEMGQNLVLSGTESHSTGAEASASPTIVPNGQPSSTSSSFDSQGQLNQLGGGVHHRPQQLLPHQRQQLQQQQQQQHQNLNLHQFDQNQQPPPPPPQPQQSPDMGSEQPNQTQQMAPAVVNRSRNRPPGTSTQMSNMAAQAVYERQKQHYQQQQRQMANHFGQSAGAPFSRTMGSNSPTQFQQQQQHPTNAALGYSGRPSPSQHQHPQQQQQQHQQHPQTQPDESTGAPSMAQFQDFNGQSYLDMDYSMNAGTAVGFDNHTQLEAALAEPDMRDRIYHAIGR
ncbi:hypothetical protein N0V84_010179 [Fusarium piperis]|uniref:Uncharacterized protein n=1 Tax=Fusarium piperis TaxID=1435070 RepID=A0A9W8W4W3_9HYPO|nr:hypothetical protein N0V84_010179 [Fusarium piperis]